MRVIRGLEAKLRRPLCLALGVFDGVHLGHRAVIGRAVARARGRDLVPAVLTFDPHPDAVLDPSGAPPLLTTTEEKLDLLRSLGVKTVVLAPFTRSLANLPAEQFVEAILVARLHARCVVVGENWRFGAGGRGTPDLLRQMGERLGFRVTEVSAVHVGNQKVSSTRLRQALSRGRVEEAQELLGRRYSLRGQVVAGDGLGRRLGFPTANLSTDPQKLLPADGIYACLAGLRKLHPAVAYIGNRPTLGRGEERRVEVHFLVAPPRPDLQGRRVRVEFVKQLRGDRQFGSEEELRQAIRGDCAGARRVLESLHE
jgi:riboflavin kinase/FMN adenylyltransferase